LSAKGHEDNPANLLDLPLRGDRGDFVLPVATERSTMPPAIVEIAPASARFAAFASDAAVVVLVVSAALLVAGSRGRWPSPAGVPWAAIFSLYLSFFVIVAPLTLFGRTVGMALSGLAAAPAGGARRLTLREASLRWAGTLLAGLTLGLAVLFTIRHREAPTPADALSKRPLVRSDAVERPAEP
jgi:uncharacterized RDD family membrane protein YckC